ncbi:hypothetical protein DPSP01_005999 [Paraphaeosphaeria sporulosa]|uniref:Uncharacterized protein n=1 Tax=Paraphaeosphaeria sporulosa TaxID=1460663 RepID=A0A177CBF2_9PLEO|nr:uncharacterized protein CC84DRAFT_1261176 [Paraphaeosphaeria sporulosa]OAG04192.1 hypothetical protein CC84DRAFT_1261176 [Paraphaeosphaeria sporulosa]
MSTPGSYASPGSAASPTSSVASSAPSPYVAVDGSDLTFPSECPENGKVIFPTRDMYSTITGARYYSRIHAQLPFQLWPMLIDIISFYPGLSDTFLTAHRNIILIYDMDLSAHERHYQTVLQMLQSQKIGWDVNRCVYARATPGEVGFAFARGGGRRTPGLMMVDIGRGGG